MKINICQTITKILDEQKNIILQRISENYILYPSEGFALKNIKTNKIYYGSFLSLAANDTPENYIEVALPKEH